MGDHYQHKQLPRSAEFIIRKILPDEGSDSPVGDFEEDFNEIVSEAGVQMAWIWYFKQILILLFQKTVFSIKWSFAMFKNNMKVVLKNIRRQKGYSFINIFGLAAGMAVCILILLYVNFELSYDKYHENADDIYRVYSTYKIGERYRQPACIPGAVGPAISENIPLVKDYVKIFNPLMFENSTIIKYGESLYEENGFLAADPGFFEFFTYEFMIGDAETALNEPGSVVITEQTAEKIFGNNDPVGETLLIENAFLSPTAFTVTGVLKNIPPNSHFRFNYLFGTSSYGPEVNDLVNHWRVDAFYTYIQLQKDADNNEIEEQINQIYKQNVSSDVDSPITDKRFHLQKMTDIHLRSNLTKELGANSHIGYIYSFLIIAVFILLIACVNFMNLMTARSTHRAREVGMRKVLGAYRGQLIRQFISESIIFSLFGLLFALILVSLLLPVFNNITELELPFNKILNTNIITFLLIMVLITGVISGSYPAFFLSSFKPAVTLKGASSGNLKKVFFRKALIVFQFAVSGALIAGTIIVYNQLHFMKKKDLGFDKEQVLVVASKELSNRRKGEVIKNAFLQAPGVKEITISSSVPGSNMNILYAHPEGYGENQMEIMRILAVDYNFIPIYNIKLLEGRNFSPDYATDFEACIINETAVSTLGWGNNAVGKKIRSVYHNNAFLNVIGVAKDFHQFSLNTRIEPMIIYLRSNNYGLYLSLKVDIESVPETITSLRNTMKEFEPGRDFEYFFLDEYFDRQYRKDDRLSTIFTYFSLITILVACLGLVGLAAYLGEQNRKEISIRKVLGANESGLILKFSNNFSGAVILANLISWPLTYFILKKYWLANFAYRIDIGPTVYILTGITTILIAFISISYQAIRAARTNPVDVLRSE